MFNYILEKIEKANIINYPFPHLDIENFLSDEYLNLIINDSQIHFDVMNTNDELYNKLINENWKIKDFPGCLSIWEDYKKFIGKNYKSSDPIKNVGITFRSGILWHGATVFPTILQSEVPTLRNSNGDIDTLNDYEEIVLLSAICRDKYDNDLGRVGVGIPTVNVRQILGGDPGTIVLGLGGCAKFDAADTECATPHDGLVGVMDNAYLHPGSPDRTLPGGGMVSLQDMWDSLTAHELV